MVQSHELSLIWVMLIIRVVPHQLQGVSVLLSCSPLGECTLLSMQDDVAVVGW